MVQEQPDFVVVEQLQLNVVSVGMQGPPGAPGSAVEGSFLQVTNRLSEFNTPEAKAAARANLELQYIDGGTFN